jgi:hypothetical protein
MKKQKIKFNNKGAYMTHYGKRIYLDEVMRSDSNEDEKIKLSKKYDSHINDVAIGYYYNYKIYILGFDDDGDAIGMVEFINYY